MTAILEARQMSAGYAGQPAIRDLDLVVDSGEIVAMLGPNGAGKTTSVLALAGALPLLGGEVRRKGAVTRASLDSRTRNGMSLVLAGRSVTASLSLRDNLRLGGSSVAQALELFPELEEHLGRRAGLLSGGQQQMVALARALARNPDLIIADELSLGLAPMVVQRLFRVLRTAASERGVGVLLVEQHAGRALRLADRGYVLRRGRMILEGPADELSARLDEIEGAYLSGKEEADEPPKTRVGGE